MCSVQSFASLNKIKHTYVNIIVTKDETGKIKKTYDASTGIQGGYKCFETKTYKELEKINEQRKEYNTLALDTTEYHQIDCDEVTLFEKYFGHLDLKNKTPYYASCTKGYPHYIVHVLNIPMNGKNKIYNTQIELKKPDGTIGIADILTGQWSYCKPKEKLINHKMEPLEIEYSVLNEIKLQVEKDSKELMMLNKKVTQENNKKKKQEEKKEQTISKKKEKEEEKKKEAKEKPKITNRKKNLEQEMIELENISIVDNLLAEIDAEIDGIESPTLQRVSRENKLLLDLLPKTISENYKSWCNMGYIISDIYKDSPKEGLERYKKFSKLCKDKYDEQAVKKQYGHYEKSRGELTIGTAKKYLKDSSIKLYNIYNDICELIKIQTGDDGLGEVMYSLYKDTYVCAYYNPSEQWYKYENGIYNELDHKCLVEKLVADVGKYLNEKSKSILVISKIYERFINNCDEDDEFLDYYEKEKQYYDNLYSLIQKKREYCALTSGKKNIYDACKTKFYVEKFEDKLNIDPNLFSFGKYILDIRTKQFRESTTNDYVSICAGITKEEFDEATEEEAEKFLTTIFPDDKEKEYMKTLLSDSLYGGTRQRFSVHRGPGGNGKGRLEEIMAIAFGGYYKTMNANYITNLDQNAVTAANSQLYKCRFARSLWFSEPPEGKALNGSIMKTLASNDEIQAREIYKSVVYFRPKFSIYISCNETFKVSGVIDNSLPRRLKFVEFTQEFVSNPDKRYKNQKQANDDFDDPVKVKNIARSMMKLLVNHYYKIEQMDKGHRAILDVIEPESCKKMRNRFFSIGDTFKEYFEDNYEVTFNKRDHKLVLSQFMVGYNNFCKERGSKALDSNMVRSKLNRLYPDPSEYYRDRTTIKQNGVYVKFNDVFLGINENLGGIAKKEDIDDMEYEENVDYNMIFTNEMIKTYSRFRDHKGKKKIDTNKILEKLNYLLEDSDDEEEGEEGEEKKYYNQFKNFEFPDSEDEEEEYEDSNVHDSDYDM